MINTTIVSKSKGVLIVFLCLICITVGQVIQMFLQMQLSKIKGFEAFANIISAVVYIMVIYILLKCIVKVFLNDSMTNYRIGKVGISWKWIIVGVILPIAVLGVYSQFTGIFYRNDIETSRTLAIITQQIFVYGLSAGIVEEMIFRGIMMGVLEKSFGKKCAIFFPSLIFALGHIAYAISNPVAAIMILISGILVGIMFSLITYEGGSIWCSALVHALWNSCTNDGIISISTIHNKNSIFSYVLDDKYAFLTAGYEAIDPSLISICGYLLVIILAIIWLKGKKVQF